ncbi:MAG: glycosyltransferase family 4 protein [Deltaproteobacteria bacterium]|nr:glycosyltransferase family 4 protein [Deltaproteobacteria bacterium]MBW1995245.1 glycosyltransferase family 4 protein [Deltaproteobacteria bacterium]MBW2154205.1 glycosyltransferase family 4 protein [Deltaproteobacteria bacterium]
MVAGSIKVVQMLPELNTGGVERGTVEFAAYLAERGHASIVISAGGRLTTVLRRQGSRHISWKVGEKSPVALQYIFRLRKLLMREQVDIVHVRSRLPAWIGYIAWKSLPKTLRPRFVTTFHGFYSVNPYSAVMCKGERVIAISRQVAEHIEAVYGVPRDRIVIIHRGVDENLFNPSAVCNSRVQRIRRQWRLSGPESPVIMLPGRFARWKGQDVFIKSLSLLKTLSWTAVCVGDTQENPSYAKELQRLIAQEQLENRVRLAGFCEDMPAAYAVSDVVVSASSSEPEAFGRIAIEAQAMGKPVIATAHGGSLETVLDGETGWLVKFSDITALAAALKEAIQSASVREKRGKNARRWVVENFTLKRMCDKTLAVYKQLIQQKKKDSGKL